MKLYRNLMICCFLFILTILVTSLIVGQDTKKKIKGAVTYPIVMFLFAIGVTIFLMTFVLPKFTNIYNGREDKLPKITKALMTFSNWLTAYGLYLLGFLILATGGSIYYVLKSPNGRIHNLATEDWERAFRINVLGAVNAF